MDVLPPPPAAALALATSWISMKSVSQVSCVPNDTLVNLNSTVCPIGTL